MGYDIYIGEIVEDISDDSLNYVVKEVEDPNAPEWNDPVDISGKTNGRHPSYTSMANYIKDSNTSIIWNELITNHPGCELLKPKHIYLHQWLLDDYKAKHPGAKAGWGNDCDFTYTRLIWYDWWFKWAMKNCEYPGVWNT